MNVTYEMALKNPDVVKLHGAFLVFERELEPLRASEDSAGVDLRSAKKYDIMPRSFETIDLGVWWNREYIEYLYEKKFMKGGFYGALHLRSSWSKSLIIPNGVGVIDLDYNGEFKIRVFNPMPNRIVTVDKGDRIAQIVLHKHYTHEMGFYTTVKRDGGFGSTGRK